MRTQTSAVQIRYMEKNKKPQIRIISIGKTYRKEATDATHEMQFQQFEGLYVDKNVSLATLKSVLNVFFDKFTKFQNFFFSCNWIFYFHLNFNFLIHAIF